MDLSNLLKSMTLSEKAALVCGADFWHSAAVSRLGISALVFSDGPHGLRFQAHQADHLGIHRSLPATCFPTSSALANAWDPDLTEKIGMAMGREASAQGVDVLLAPAMNIIRNPAGGRSFEYYSEDPYLTGVLAAALTRGIQKYVSACPKHFLLNSQETRRMSIDERADERTIHELYLPAFQRVIREADPDWIMTSYNKVNGIYASESPELYGYLKDLGFSGATVTDWGGGNDIVKAIQAGSSLEMPGTEGESRREIIQAVEKGILKEEDLDLRVREVLEAIQKVQNRKAVSLDKKIQPNFRHHHILAVEAAARSAVLLQNDGILPLQTQKIAWIGPFENQYPIQGGGSSYVEATVRTPFSVLLKRSSLHSSGVAQGYPVSLRQSSRLLEKRALDLAQTVDVIVFLAVLPQQEQLEGLDRQSHAVPEQQVRLYKKLLETGKPVILIDAIAGPVEIPLSDQFAAILYTGLSGQGAPEALLQILSGKINPSGHLAQTFAFHWKDYPSSSSFPASGAISSRPEGMHVGYRAFLRQDVLFPFGYGLSYTSFTCTSAYCRLKEKEVLCTISNTGKREGTALIQVYVQKPKTDYRELAGFSTVRLRAGTCKTIRISIDSHAWMTYSPAEKRWVSIEGDCQIQLAWNAKDIIHRWLLHKEKGNTEAITVFAPVSEQSSSEAEKSAEQPSADNCQGYEAGLIEKPDFGMDATIGDLKDSSSRLLSFLARNIVKGRDFSLRLKYPNLLLISLADMPLKGLVKFSPQFFNTEMVRALLNHANYPDIYNFVILFNAVMKKVKSESGSI